MSDPSRLGLETLCVHAGVEPDPATGAIMTPIFQSSTFVQKAPAQHEGFEYSRSGNPTRKALQGALSGIEGARHALTFSSGMAAEQAIVQLLEPGDHVVVSEDIYGGTGRLFRRLFARYGIRFDFLDLGDLDALEEALDESTALVWVETPTNPLIRIVDIAAVAERASKVGAKVVVDNTFCTPILQRPLELGADLVVYSTTKYMAGHSDLVGGAIVTDDDDLAERLGFIQFAAGAVDSPFENFLLLRSLKTLALRMERHSTNGLAFARAMESLGAFETVLYPGLESHPDHDLARRQMAGGFSGIVTVRLDGDMDRVTRFLTSFEVFSLAESLGGVESLVNHPETMTHASVPPPLREKLGIDAGLVRFSVGVERVEDLIADVERALGA